MPLYSNTFVWYTFESGCPTIVGMAGWFRLGITTQGSLSVMVSVISCRVQSNSF